MSEFKAGAATVRSVWEMSDSSFQRLPDWPAIGCESLLLARKRPPAWKPVVDGLELNLFSHIQGVVHLNPGYLTVLSNLGMTEKKLDCTQVTGLAINLGSLRATHRVRAVRC
jgi:hypothetical protein